MLLFIKYLSMLNYTANIIQRIMYKTKCFYVLQHKWCDTLEWEGKIFFKEMIENIDN